MRIFALLSVSLTFTTCPWEVPEPTPVEVALEQCLQGDRGLPCRALGDEAIASGRFDLAREALARGCQLDDGSSCSAVAALLEHGQGGPSSALAARARYNQACALGELGACVELGLLRSDLGDADGARTILLRACEREPAGACNDLGVKLISEDRVLLGREILGASCAKQVGAACGNLGRLARDGKGEPSDLVKAAGLLDQACRLEDGTACRDLAALAAQEGQEPRARALAARACRLGVVQSCTTQATNE